MDALALKIGGGEGGKRKARIARLSPVPLVEEIMHQRAAQRRIAERIGGQRLQLAQIKDRLRVELVGIAQQPVERSHFDRHVAQGGRRMTHE